MTMILSVLILKNFGKFTGKSVAESLKKVAGRKSAIILKEILWLRCFPCNFG